jgi:hypothetical protein
MLQESENEIRSAMMIGYVGSDAYVDRLLAAHAQAAVAVAGENRTQCTTTDCGNEAYLDVAPEGSPQEILKCSRCFNDAVMKALDSTGPRVITV